MNTSRLEAFNDAILAIVITIMVLELEPPHETTLKALKEVLPVFFSYLFSFVYLATYWNNHHHLMQVSEEVNGKILWANLNLLFWLSLIPFTTSWIGINYIDQLPVIVYGVVLLLSAISFLILKKLILKYHDDDSTLNKVVQNNKKEKISIAIYIIGIVLTLFFTWAGIISYLIVLIMWIMPSKRIEEEA